MKDFETAVTSIEDGIKIGRILGTKQTKGIGIATDGEKACVLIADAIKLGVMFSGGTVYNYGEQNMPIMRSAVRFLRNDYGVYIYKEGAVDRNGVKIVLTDRYGIELSYEQIEVLLSNGKFELDSLEYSDMQDMINTVESGCEKNLSEFKTYYMRHIINSVKSKEFKVNFNITTGLRQVSEVLSGILSEFYSFMNPEYVNNYEFGGEITNGGDKIILKKSDGTELSEEQAVSVMTYVLLRDSGLRTFVLPETVSHAAEDAILELGGNVIRASGSRRQRMEKMIEYGNNEQLMMEFDGVYAAVRILDFLNRYEVSFDSLVDHLPNVFKAEAEVELQNKKTEDIMRQIKRRYHGKETGSGSSIRIETEDGIALIVPKSAGNIIKIITEAESMEAAEEISTLFKNKIKSLAKD